MIELYYISMIISFLFVMQIEKELNVPFMTGTILIFIPVINTLCCIFYFIKLFVKLIKNTQNDKNNL